MIFSRLKSYLFLFFTLSIIGLAVVFWQNDTGMIISSDASWNKIVDTTIKPEAMEYKEDIRESATVRFCNDGKIQKNLMSNIKPGESKEFCLYFKNESSQNVYYDVEFIWWYTDKDWSRFCYLADEPGNFPEFVEKTRKDKVYVKKRSNVIKKFSVKFPIGIKWWMHQWCVWYSIEWTDYQASSMINLRFRKVNYMDFLVGWESVIESIVALEWLNVSFDENTNKLIVAGWIKNSWSLDQIVDITWVIYNMFWYRKEFSFSWIKLPISTLKEFNTKDIESILDTTIPFYKWLFNVELTVNHKPYFSFDVTNAWIDQKILEWESFVEKTAIFLFPWTIIGMFIIFLFLLRLAFFKKPRVIYVEKNSYISK